MPDHHHPVGISDNDVARFQQEFASIVAEIGKKIVGCHEIVTQLLIALLAGGHVLIEGVPGLGKTMLARSLAEVLAVSFSRIQFTPDLLPSDILGTAWIMEDAHGKRGFQFQKGPIFANLILIDEINRATPKTQSALLQCMQEGNVTTAGETYMLEQPFCVVATQNPIEMEGTYPLPEAQLDRFLFKAIMPYPSRQELNQILERTTANLDRDCLKKIGKPQLQQWCQLAREVYLPPPVQDYAVRLILATHPHSGHKLASVAHYVRYGASPRGAQSLVLAAKVKALIDGRCSVSFDDIAHMVKPALRHRILLKFDAEADNIATDKVLEDLLTHVPRVVS